MVWPFGCVCQAVRAPGVKWTLLAETRRAGRRRDRVYVHLSREPVTRPGCGRGRVPRDLHVVPPLSARHELERRGAGLWGDDAVDDGVGVAAVLRAVRGVQLVDVVVGLDEADVLVDAAGSNASFVPCLCA